MSMMNKYAKLNGDFPSGYRLQFIPTSVIELSETATFVHNFV